MGLNDKTEDQLLHAYIKDEREMQIVQAFIAKFHEFDSDGSGSLEKDEFVKMCVAGGKSKCEAARIFGYCDHAAGGCGDGKVTVQEFIIALCACAFEAVFNQLDADGSGSLDKKELASLCEMYKQKGYDDENLKRVYDLWDADGKDGISLNEFIAHFCCSAK